MKLENALRWSWMNVLNAKRAEFLQRTYGSLDAALEQVTEKMLRDIGCREDTTHAALSRLEEFDLAAYAALLRKKDILFLTIDDDLYPSALRTLPDPPVFLYARGDLGILDEPCIALVGSRVMNEEGRRIVGRFVPDIVRAGCITVSGLAYGIDAEVARETLHASGRTVAVLGSGFGNLYPKGHEKLAEEIVKQGGLVLSEFPHDQRPDNFTFPARNRIIAGLSLATVVVQAAERSGSLITAELALEYSREVAAVPGSVFDPLFAGCNSLIARGQAKLVTSAAGVLEEVGIVASDRAPTTKAVQGETPEEDRILSALTTLPIPLDDLVIKAKLDAAALTATLTVLELKGAVRKVEGKWVRA